MGLRHPPWTIFCGHFAHEKNDPLQGHIQGVCWVRTNPLKDKEIFFEAIVVGIVLNLVGFGAFRKKTTLPPGMSDD